ncbi:MAG: hypothetical protein IJV05_11665 [Muribaculaceae bacterium]|nr:hypothetical protein [Muribaculaceae bacterium]
MRKVNVITKVLLVLQLLSLASAIVILLLDDATNPFALLIAAPFMLVAALLLIGLMIHLLANRQYRLTIHLVTANLLTLVVGCVSIFFTSRLYNDYMLSSMSDTIPYEMIPPHVIFPDSTVLDRVYVIHHSVLCRKHLFSNEFVMIDNDYWNERNKGWWQDYYTVQLKQDTTVKAHDISSIDIKMIGVDRDSVIWMGSVGSSQQFDYRNHKVPADTIRFQYMSSSGKPDTIMVVKAIN